MADTRRSAIDAVILGRCSFLAAGVVILGALGFSGCATSARLDQWSAHAPSGAEAKGPPAYPAWFLKTPLRGEAMMAVGYAPMFAYIETSMAAARKNALENLAMTKNLHVHGERGFQQTTQGTAARGSIITETPAGTVDDLFLAGYVAIDSAIVGSMVLFLVATTDIAAPGGHHTKQARPAWLTDAPTSADHEYAVGVSGLHFYEHNAWLTAEQHARQQLAVGRMSQFTRRWTTQNLRSSDITVQRTDVVLDGFQVVERYADRKNRLFFVLARCQRELGAAGDSTDR